MRRKRVIKPVFWWVLFSVILVGVCVAICLCENERREECEDFTEEFKVFLMEVEGFTSGKALAFVHRRLDTCWSGHFLSGLDLDMHGRYLDWIEKRGNGGGLETL